MNYFTGCTDPASIKARYRQLAMEHHPDRGGDTATMQAINSQYHDALKRCDGHTSPGTDGKPHTYHYNEANEAAITEKIDELLMLRLPHDVDLWLIGSWVWVKGNTKPHRESLKDAGLIWHRTREAWYWKPYEGRTRPNKNADFGDLAAKYGAKSFRPADPEAIPA